MSARKALAKAAAMAATADALQAEVFSACDDSTEAIGMVNTGPVVQVPNSLEVGVPAGSSWRQPSRAWQKQDQSTLHSWVTTSQEPVCVRGSHPQ